MNNGNSYKLIDNIIDYNILGDNVILNVKYDENIIHRYPLIYGEKLLLDEKNVIIINGRQIASTYDGLIVKYKDEAIYKGEDNTVLLLPDKYDIFLTDIRRRKLIEDEVSESEIGINPGILKMIANYAI